MATWIKFPIYDGFADTCIGMTASHGTNEDMEAQNGFCADCQAQIDAATAHLFVRPTQQATNCCSGHVHGSRYYDCMCCYGD